MMTKFTNQTQSVPPKVPVYSYHWIQEIYSERKGINRKFVFAKVMKTDGSFEPFNLSYLTKESKQKQGY